jgi:hypothetical protein
MSNIADIVVVGAVRTPMGNFGGTLKDFKSFKFRISPSHIGR